MPIFDGTKQPIKSYEDGLREGRILALRSVLRTVLTAPEDFGWDALVEWLRSEAARLRPLARRKGAKR